ncbi:MAG TPA: HPF/RaiA family ribosome-associated protein [Chitinophagaceae bacterium]|nr:HPF/RaiA family ribosome-associated protein [Chitinophagaceae bacterium]
MHVQIKTTRFNADSKLLYHVRRQVNKLPDLEERITSIDIYLKLDNIAHQIKDKEAGIRVHVPHHEFFAHHQSKSFEQSFDLAFDSLVSQIKRQKEKNGN